MHNSSIDSMLETRFAAQVREGPDDWQGVLRVAGLGQRRTYGLSKRAALSVAAAVLVVSVAPALAFTDVLSTRIFGNEPPSPQAQVLSFAALDKEAPSGMAPGVASAQARRVIDQTLPGGEVADVDVAPTAGGGFCTFLSVTPSAGEGRGGSLGCDRSRSLQLGGGYTIPGPVRNGVIERGPVVVSGSTLLEHASQLVLRFEDGSTQTIPLVWVTTPINAGFFVASVSSDHWSKGRLPLSLEAQDSHGVTLETMPMEIAALASSAHQ